MNKITRFYSDIYVVWRNVPIYIQRLITQGVGMRFFLPLIILAAVCARVQAQTKVDPLRFGTAVENREIVGESDSFAAGTERVYCWVRVTGGKGQTLTAKWTLGEQVMAEVALDIQFDPMRTYCSKAIAGSKGVWKVEIIDTAGEVLQSGTFTIN